MYVILDKQTQTTMSEHCTTIIPIALALQEWREKQSPIGYEIHRAAVLAQVNADGSYTAMSDEEVLTEVLRYVSAMEGHVAFVQAVQYAASRFPEHPLGPTIESITADVFIQ